jgi:hypothetical protein
MARNKRRCQCHRTGHTRTCIVHGFLDAQFVAREPRSCPARVFPTRHSIEKIAQPLECVYFPYSLDISIRIERSCIMGAYMFDMHGEKRIHVNDMMIAHAAAVAAAAPGAAPAVFLASSAAATAGFTFLPSFHRTLGGGARLRRPTRERTRTTTQTQMDQNT